MNGAYPRRFGEDSGQVLDDLKSSDKVIIDWEMPQAQKPLDKFG
jgi:hypothetical protein